MSLPANGGNADTLDGKDASGFVETSKVLTTKEQIEANTDANNVAGATALKEISKNVNDNLLKTPQKIIDEYVSGNSVEFTMMQGSYLIVVLSNFQSYMRHNVYIASRQINGLPYAALTALLEQADTETVERLPNTNIIRITTTAENGARIVVTKL